MSNFKNSIRRLFFLDSYKLEGDNYIWGCVLFWTLLSILGVYSATGTLAFKKLNGDTEYYLISHGAKFMLGLGMMYLFHKFDYRWFFKTNKLIYGLCVAFLVFGVFYGSSLNQAQRWVNILGFTLQPADLAKMGLMIILATQISKDQNRFKDSWFPFIKMVITISIPCGIIMLSDISTGLLLMLNSLVLMVVGRVPMKQLLLTGLIVVILGGVAGAFMGSRVGTAMSRLESFANSIDDISSLSYQSKQGLIAIGNAGFQGLGPGNSEQKNFLPHPYSDFIFAIIVEEYGLAGGILVILFYMVFLWRSFALIAYTQQPFGGLLSAGLAFGIVMQAMVNMGVTVGILPVTGLPLPMISMGGSSLLFVGASIGIIQSVARGSKNPDFEAHMEEVEEEEVPVVKKGNRFNVPLG
ncbi:FtsW/RodA/SpoVE family cell cycle protein [Persicobacter diffluens]|uniref:Probable peptidoglycan glycosyltransferase FtsW n=1 Tax=Persicobacter diffluens TaxID=981 RepID=A0AAN5AJ43_9BACT|nr:cell division protein FtsW [Persicobacter diffluens]